MKMDATQKRRMWKVAIAHFALTLFVVWKLIHHSAWSGSFQREVWFNAWGSFWRDVFNLLQPQYFLADQLWFFHLMDKLNFPNWPIAILFFGSIPIWSICCGWIFVKLDNWLNHFPVLGKRVL
jgi:hypothetical protein